MKSLFLFISMAGTCLAAGTVRVDVSQLGRSSTWVLTYHWTGDSNNGSVPSTPAPMALCCQGFLPVQVEVSNGTPTPTNGYTVQVTDVAGYDILGGQAAAVSSASTISYAAPITVTPVQGTLTLNLTGNTVPSATGTVYVFLTQLNGAPINLGLGYLLNSGITFGVTQQLLGSTVTNLNAVNMGPSTPGTGAFTTLSASSTVSGTGFSNYLASPPAIGGTTPSTGAFTTLSTTGPASFGNVILYTPPSSTVNNYVAFGGIGSLANAQGSYLSVIRNYDAQPQLILGGTGNLLIEGSYNSALLGTGPIVSNSGVLANATAANNGGVLTVTQCTACALNGTTDDTAAFQNWFNSVANGTVPVTISFAGKYIAVTSPTLQSPLNLSRSHVHWVGPGGFVGTAINETGGYPVPTSYISIAGSLGTAYSYGSAIAQNTISFTLSNAFTENQMFLLSNFPYDSAHANGTYPAGSDTCTLATGNPQNQCNYPSAIATTTGSASGSSTTLTVASGAGTVNGQYVWGGANIPTGTTISSGGGTTTWTLSQATTGALSGQTINTYSTSAAAILGNDTSGQGPNNLRQNRRQEVGLIRSATGSALIAMDPILQPYASTTALQFQVVTPIEDVTFEDVTLNKLWIQSDLTRNVTFRGFRALQSSINYSRSIWGTVDPNYMDNLNCDCGVSVGLGSRKMTIRGNYGNGAIDSDNGSVRCDMCSDTDINVTLGAQSQSVTGLSGSGQVMENIIIDTGYAENPSGYTTGGDYGLTIKANASGTPCTVGLVLFGGPWGNPIQNVNIDYTTQQLQGNTGTCYGAAVQMSGVQNGTVKVNAPYGTIYAQGNQALTFSGTAHRFYSAAPVTDPYFGNSPQSNVGLDFNGIRFISASTDGTASQTPFYCQYCDNTKLSSVVFDQTAYNNGVNIGNTSKDIFYGNVTWLMSGAAVPAFDCSAFSGTFHVLGDVQFPTFINASDCGPFSTYLHNPVAVYGMTIGNPNDSSQVIKYSRAVYNNTTTWAPGTLANGANITTTTTIYSAPQGLPVYCGLSSIGTGQILLNAIMTSYQTVTVTVTNNSGGSVTIPSGTLTCAAFVP